jgi:hypothetical protein
VTEPGSVVRTRDHVEREYGEEKWPAVEQLIQSERAVEPDAGLSRILTRVLRAQYRTSDPLEPRPFVLDGRRASIPSGGAFGAAQFIVQDAIADACLPETDLLVELGSGWGWQLLAAWAGGGPRHASYVAAEYTEAGRRAAAALAELDGRLDFRAIHFDYHEPELRGLGAHRHAVVFTAHSIEQIPHVKPELVEAIRRVAREVTCLHFEPVGWQLDHYSDVGSTREYAERHDYNRNLIPVLRAAEAAGDIAIELIHPDVFGIKPENSTTAIRWKSLS